MSTPSTWPMRALVMALAAIPLIPACSGGDSTPTPRGQSDTGGTPTPSPTPSPTATSEPAAFAGYDLALAQGTFWTYRWEHTDGSCAQGSGCSSSTSTKERLVLVASSLRGDALPAPTPTTTAPPAEVDKREPNDSTAQAQRLHLAQTLFGTIAVGDAFAGPEVLATIDGERLILQAEDHYRFDLMRSIRVGIALQVEAGASVALVLWDDATAKSCNWRIHH